jgi:hypothetical protein
LLRLLLRVLLLTALLLMALLLLHHLLLRLLLLFAVRVSLSAPAGLAAGGT